MKEFVIQHADALIGISGTILGAIFGGFFGMYLQGRLTRGKIVFHIIKCEVKFFGRSNLTGSDTFENSFSETTKRADFKINLYLRNTSLMQSLSVRELKLRIGEETGNAANQFALNQDRKAPKQIDYWRGPDDVLILNLLPSESISLALKAHYHDPECDPNNETWFIDYVDHKNRKKSIELTRHN